MLDDARSSADGPMGADGPGGLGIAVLAPALLLAACGDGGTTTAAATSSPGITVAAASVTPVQASRFLGQSTMGATRTMVDALVARGFDGWLTDQLAMPRATSHWDWLVAGGYDAAANVNTEAGYDATVWRQLIVEPD